MIWYDTESVVLSIRFFWKILNERKKELQNKNDT